MTFWELERLVIQVVFLALFFRIMYDLKQLVHQGQVDKKAREATIVELKETAMALAKRTAEIQAASDARVDANESKLQNIERITRDTNEIVKKKNGEKH